MSCSPALIGALPALDQWAPYRLRRPCKVCGGDAVHFDSVDFNKLCDVDDYYKYGVSGVLVDFLRCLACGLVFTECFDEWTTEDFAKLIYNKDYVKVDGDYVDHRPTQYAEDFTLRFRGCEHARILDYGSGSGVFVEQMRQHGYTGIEGYDPFSSPARPSGRFDIITCFEVIEHSRDPENTLVDMRSLMRPDGCIVFSQTTQPPDILSVRGSWWYLAPRNGHVTTYSEESLVELGRRQGLALHRGSSIYAFSPSHPSSLALVAVNWVGPSLTVVRLLAPREAGTTAIAFPTPGDVIWSPIEQVGLWNVRWVAAPAVAWNASWPAISRLQVRVPVARQCNSGFEAPCELELHGSRKPVHPDRGELVAEFDVKGSTSGQITLHIPKAPEGAETDVPGMTKGRVAILVSQLPSEVPYYPA